MVEDFFLEMEGKRKKTNGHSVPIQNNANNSHNFSQYNNHTCNSKGGGKKKNNSVQIARVVDKTFDFSFFRVSIICFCISM